MQRDEKLTIGPMRAAVMFLVLLGWPGLVWGGSATPDRPSEIRSWRHQMFPTGEYVLLAREWGAYVEAHPGDARAWINWADALRYAGQRREAEEKYARAYAVDSTDAVVIEAYASVIACYAKGSPYGQDGPDWRCAHRLLLKAAEIDPHFPETYYTLWMTALRQGDEDLATESLRRIAVLGDLPRALLDYGANMVLGAPENAIILTNGDNDTYPPLAFQATTGRRSDVAIVNLSLLNTHSYIRHWRDRGLPIEIDDDEIEKLQAFSDPLSQDYVWIADQIQLHLFSNLQKAGWPRPLLYATTVSDRNRVMPAKLVLEGLLNRVVPAEPSEVGRQEYNWTRNRELFDTLYRLDSATDPWIDWEQESSVGSMMLSFAAALVALSEHIMAQGKRAEAADDLFAALKIMALHDRPEHVREVLAWWEREDPSTPLLQKVKQLIEGDE